MTESLKSRTGGQILVDQLVAQGVAPTSIACPANPIWPRSTRSTIPASAVTICRQEAGAAMMAGTLGRLTGRPGVCFVTRGPGATNAAHGVHIAEHDSAPMILFVGQVERAMRGRGAFQEMDYRALFGSTTKWAVEIEIGGADPRSRPARLPLRHAGPPRPGRDRAARGRADRHGRSRRRAARRGRADLAGPDADGRVAEAAVGGASARSSSSAAPAGRKTRAPACCASPSGSICPSRPQFRRASALDGEHPNYCGEIGLGINPKLKARASRTPISCC